MPPENPLLYRVVLAILCFLFVYPYKVEYCSFKVCDGLCWDLDGDCIESVDCFWPDCHFYYVDPTYQRAWEIFPFSGIFFNFFL